MSDTPLHEACLEASLETARQLLDSDQGRKYLEVRDDDGGTPLHHAACRDKSGKIVELLIQQGANIQAVNFLGMTPLMIASANNNTSAALVLLRHGANIKTQNDAGWTALNYAFLHGCKEVAEIILNFVVDSAIASSSSLSLGLGKGLDEARNLMSILDNSDRTALDWANLNSKKEIVQWWESFQREKKKQQERLQRLDHRDFIIESKDELQLLLSLYPDYLQQLVEWKSNDQTTRGDSKNNSNNNKEWNELEEKIRSYLKDVKSIEKDYGDSLPTLASLQNDKAETYNRAKAVFDRRKKQLQQDKDQMNQKRQQSVLSMQQSVAGRNRQSPSNMSSSNPKTSATMRETMFEEQVSLDPNHPVFNGIELKELENFEQELIVKYGSREVYRTKTMRDIVRDVITPICNKVNKSYAEHLNDKKDDRRGDGHRKKKKRKKKKQKKKADAFVTHCWDEPFYLLVAALQMQFGNSFHSTSFWICSFSIRQGDSQLIQDELNKELDQCPFVLALKEAPQFVVFRNSRTDLYSRIWCVCELVFAYKYGKFAEDDGTAHYRPPVVLGDNSKFIDATSSCLDATADNIDDRERILLFLLSERGARKRIDALIGKLRKFRGRAIKAD